MISRIACDLDQICALSRRYDCRMQYRNSVSGYGIVSLSLHWLTAGLVAVAWTLGTFSDVLPKGAARAFGIHLHILTGLTIVGVVLIRLVWRAFDPPPPSGPTALGAWLDRAAHFAHYALYGLLIGALVSGIVLQFARGNALPLFGIYEIASPWPADRAFSRKIKGVHELLANGLVVLAGLHAAASLFHHWILRDRTLLRMLPESRRR